MDYFTGITNDDLKDYYLIDLHSRMELTQYTLPHEFLEPGHAIDDHIIRCQNLLKDYLLKLINDNDENLDEEKCMEIYEAKRKELHSLINPASESYYEQVKVHYIHL